MVSAGRATVSHAIRIGRPAEMAEIGVEGLCTRDHEKHGAKRQQADVAVAQEKAHAVDGIERREHAGVLRHYARRRRQQ